MASPLRTWFDQGFDVCLPVVSPCSPGCTSGNAVTLLISIFQVKHGHSKLVWCALVSRTFYYYRTYEDKVLPGLLQHLLSPPPNPAPAAPSPDGAFPSPHLSPQQAHSPPAGSFQSTGPADPLWGLTAPPKQASSWGLEVPMGETPLFPAGSPIHGRLVSTAAPGPPARAGRSRRGSGSVLRLGRGLRGRRNPAAAVLPLHAGDPAPGVQSHLPPHRHQARKGEGGAGPRPATLGLVIPTSPPLFPLIFPTSLFIFLLDILATSIP